MTNDEVATRLIRLEARLTAVTAMVHCLLPATVPHRRELVGKQFGFWRTVMENDLRAASGDPAETTLQIDVIAVYHEGLLATLKKLDEMDAQREAMGPTPPNQSPTST